MSIGARMMCFTVFLFLCSTTSWGSEPNAKLATTGKSSKQQKVSSAKKPFKLAARLDPALAPSKTEVPAQKKWLKRVLTFGVKSRDFRKAIVKKIDRMSDPQINQLVVLAKKRLHQIERDQLEIAKRNLERARRSRKQLQYQRNRVGFRPVVSNLITGPRLTAGAVVSPDRRHVRLNLNAIFSQLGAVDTFNFRTGEVRRIYTPPRQRRRKPVRVYYDGVRTRVGTPPSSISGKATSQKRRAVFLNRVKR